MEIDISAHTVRNKSQRHCILNIILFCGYIMWLTEIDYVRLITFTGLSVWNGRYKYTAGGFSTSHRRL